MSRVEVNTVLDRQLLDIIDIAYRDDFLLDGSKPNQSIAELMKKPGRARNEWRGPILAYGRKGLTKFYQDPPSCRDLDLVDFRHIVDFFRPFNTIEAPCFEAFEVPTNHAIFKDHHTSDIAARVGLPLLTHKEPYNPNWETTENQAAVFLHLSCGDGPSTDRLWGWVSFHWQLETGSVLVFECGPLFEHSMGVFEPEKPISRGLVLAHITRPFFVLFWERFRREEGDKGNDKIELASSPYDSSEKLAREFEAALAGLGSASASSDPGN
ncbi:Zinc finger mynd-type protein [Neofusicoccum parvum]|nr:Zinc finger mynd-type protein [Neofusicoccum parvum]